jgi:hypothetical protein
MTLIAGFEVAGVPLLLGDFMISGHPEIKSQKKVFILTENIAIAWAGNLYQARCVFRNLKDRFSGTRPSKEEFDDFLKSYRVPDADAQYVVHVIGWIVDDASLTGHCFCWSSANSTNIVYGDYFIKGTGTKTLEDTLKSKVNLQGKGDVSAIAAAKSYAVSHSCTLMSDVILDRAHEAEGFGVAYEVIYYDDNRFAYINDIIYTILDLDYDVSTGRGTYNSNPSIIKYHSGGEFSLVQTRDEANKIINLNFITPVYDDLQAEYENIKRNRKPLSLVSDYYCLFCRFKSSDGINETLSMVFSAEQQNSPVYVDKDGFLNFDFAFVPIIHKNIKDLRSG